MVEIPEYTQISKMFVEGNVQDSFKKIHIALENLKMVMGSQISRVYVQLSLVTQTPLQFVNDAKMRSGIQADLQSAKKSLQLYTRTYSIVTTRLAIASSNFSLPQFLAKNGIPSSEANALSVILSKSLRRYWDETYGQLAEKAWQSSLALKKLIDLLEQQIELMEAISSGKIEYMKAQQTIAKLFEQEKKTYWKEFFPATDLEAQASRVGLLLNAQLQEFTSIVAAKEEAFHRSFSEDIGDRPTPGRVIIVTIVYLLGFISLLISIKGDLYRALPGKIAITLFSKNGLSARGYNLLNQAQSIAGKKTGQGVEELAKMAQQTLS